jgi:hypothetical protein
MGGRKMKTYFRLLVGIFLSALIVLLAPAYKVRAASINVGCDVPELIAAIDTANSTAEPDILELAADCLYSVTTVHNLEEEDGPNGLPRITTDITIHGNNATIERNLAAGNMFRLFFVENAGALTLDTLTLQNGDPGSRLFNGFPLGYSSGAIQNNGGTLVIQSSTFKENHVELYDWGGCGGAISSDGTITIQDSLFEQNRGSCGGAILQNGDLTIQNTVFRDNYGSDGGALSAGGGTILVASSLFTKNAADAGEGPHSGTGGAIRNWGEMTLQDSTVRENTSNRGGAILNNGVLTILRSTLTKNEAYHGGAIINFGELVLANSTFFKNHAFKSGGVVKTYRTLKIRNSTLASNSSDGSGGNIYMDDLFDEAFNLASNSIFVNGKPENCVGRLEDRGGNVRFPATDQSCVGIHGDPKLGPLADNGGLTKTMALEPGSAAINQGNATVCKSGVINNRDQRGVKRVRAGDTRCDSGAFEVK